MVYITRWEDFETAAIELYKKSPSKARYCVKFRPKDGELILKVTDDFKCLKFKTRSSIILNRFESLNLRLLLSMTARSAPTASSTTAAPSGLTDTTGEMAAGPSGADAGGDAVMKDVTGDAVTPGAATSGKTGGGKKKKKGKK